MIKLNLGSHDRIIPGYDNMDFGDYTGVKYKGDVSDLSRFKDGEIDVIRASHILEHFSHIRTADILKEWRRALKADGLLYISVPDWDRLLSAYRHSGLCDWVVTTLYGDQGYEGAEHKNVFDESRLTNYLIKAGFKDISRVEMLPDSSPQECTMNVGSWDGKFISLNIVAVKD